MLMVREAGFQIAGTRADDAYDARGWLPDCRNMGLLMRIGAHGAGGWLPDCRNKGLMMLMMLGAGFGIAGT